MCVIENSNNFITLLNTINGASIRSQLFGYSAARLNVDTMRARIEYDTLHYLYAIARAVIAIEKAFDATTSTTDYMSAMGAQVSALRYVCAYRVNDSNLFAITQKYIESLESAE